MKVNKIYIPWLLMLLACAGGLLQYHFICQLAGFSYQLGVAGSLIGTLLLALGIYGSILIIKIYPTKVSIYPYALGVSILFAIFTVFAEWYLLKAIAKNQIQYSAFSIWYLHSVYVRFLIIWLLYSWIASTTALRKNIESLDARFHKHADAALMLREAELFKLRQQLQPHFLYNSLNSINALILISPERAQEMVGRLSDFLRDSVRRESEDSLPINEEIRYIESYLAIESIRFGERLSISFTKSFRDTDTIPPFLFQPLLENAVKFGLYGNTGVVCIDISICSVQDMLELKITNPYNSNEQPVKGTGFGLAGVGRRLFLLFARNDLLETVNDERQFTTKLKIPQHV